MSAINSSTMNNKENLSNTSSLTPTTSSSSSSSSTSSSSSLSNSTIPENYTKWHSLKNEESIGTWEDSSVSFQLFLGQKPEPFGHFGRY